MHRADIFKSTMPSKHNQSQTCPFIDDGYVSCASRFTLAHLDEACDVCLGSYNTCQVYHRLSGIQRNPSLDMRINGQAVELRPTGS